MCIRDSAYTPNFIWMCSLCRIPVAKKHNFGQFLIFGGLLYRPSYTGEGQVWCARADPDQRSTLTGQISFDCVRCVGFRWKKATIFWQILTFWGAPVPTPFYRWGPNLKVVILNERSSDPWTIKALKWHVTYLRKMINVVLRSHPRRLLRIWCQLLTWLAVHTWSMTST